MAKLSNIPIKGTWNNIQSILTENFQKLYLLLQGAENIDISVDGDYIKITDKDGVEHSIYAKGNTGSSVDYPFELVNALTQATSGKALDAYQGKVLKDLIDAKGDAFEVITNLNSTIPTDGKTYVAGASATKSSIGSVSSRIDNLLLKVVTSCEYESTSINGIVMCDSQGYVGWIQSGSSGSGVTIDTTNHAIKIN